MNLKLKEFLTLISLITLIKTFQIKEESKMCHYKGIPPSFEPLKGNKLDNRKIIYYKGNNNQLERKKQESQEDEEDYQKCFYLVFQLLSRAIRKFLFP